MGTTRLKHDPPDLAHTIMGAKAAVALALFWLPGQPAFAQSRLTAHYALSLAGLTIGEGDWEVEIEKGIYKARSSGQFFGLWRTILGGDVSAATYGTASQGRLVPTSYVANFSSDDNIDDVRMTLRDGVVSELEAKPPIPDSQDRIAITAADLRGVIDPLTAGLVSVPGTGSVATSAACQRTLPIFDGTHRFDMLLSFKRMETIASGTGYRGPAVVCAMSYRPIAGYSPNAFRVDYLKKNHDMEMWLAPVEGTRLLAAFRILVPTMLGHAALGATRFESSIR
jgi:hypothetical protein